MDWGYIQTILPNILQGAWFTIIFFFEVFGLSMLMATTLAIIFQFENKIVNYIITIFTSLIRGTPLLFQLYFMYFGLPILFSVKIDAITAATISFVISWTAYLTENIKGAITSIDKGQSEAAFILGLNKFQTMVNIILPQAFAGALPSISNEAVNLVYGTALLSVLGLDDLLRNARIAVIRDLRLEAFLVAAVIYALFCGLIIFIFKQIQKYSNRYKNAECTKD